jgi:hypothetical protein
LTVAGGAALAVMPSNNVASRELMATPGEVKKNGAGAR